MSLSSVQIKQLLEIFGNNSFATDKVQVSTPYLSKKTVTFPKGSNLPLTIDFDQLYTSLVDGAKIDAEKATIALLNIHKLDVATTRHTLICLFHLCLYGELRYHQTKKVLEALSKPQELADAGQKIDNFIYANPSLEQIAYALKEALFIGHNTFLEISSFSDLDLYRKLQWKALCEDLSNLLKDSTSQMVLKAVLRKQEV